MTYSFIREIPSVETYRALRSGSGLSEKTIEAAEHGLPKTLFAAQVLDGDCPVGMGRVVGDGGCFYQVVDIAVLKHHQGKGIGKMIMSEIVQYLEANVSESGYVSLIADGPSAESVCSVRLRSHGARFSWHGIQRPPGVGCAVTRHVSPRKQIAAGHKVLPARLLSAGQQSGNQRRAETLLLPSFC